MWYKNYIKQGATKVRQIQAVFKIFAWGQRKGKILKKVN